MGEIMGTEKTTVENLGETLVKVIESLAGKGSNLELNFKDLTVDVGGVKAKLSGSVVLNVLYVTEKK